jgi:uncharacterized protein involved in response to NO
MSDPDAPGAGGQGCTGQGRGAMSGLRHLFSAGYRVFFLAAGILALLTMLVWEGWLAVQAAGGVVSDLPFAMAPQVWHAHELIFGYGAAAMAGFLMTAAPGWVKAQGATPTFLALAALVWLIGRVAIWCSAMLPAWVVAMLDLAFLPILAAKIAWLLSKRPKPRQMVFLGLLALFWTANLFVHLEWLGIVPGGGAGGLRAGLLTLAALIMILGGRVTPSFTRNAMLQAGRETGLPRDLAPLTGVAVLTVLSLPLLALFSIDGPVLAVAALIAGSAGLARLGFWRGGWTLRQPILWSLHLGYGFNAVGLIMFGMSALGVGSDVAALHLLGIGAVAGMTMAVMSRAALGHSGRALVAPGPVAMAYALIPLAALARFATSLWPAFYYPGVLAAGALWIIAYGLFLTSLWPVFVGPRLDANKKGEA